MSGASARRRADGISAQVPDWSRERKPFFAWVPSRSLLAAIRSYQRWTARRGAIAWFGRKLAVLRHRWWSIVTGADIPINCQIAGGLLIPHPNGIVVHPGAIIGPNCLVMQQVTLGSGKGGSPLLGGHVDIGAGAKLLGPIKIGDHAKVGANALVIHDVPPGGVAVAPLSKIFASDEWPPEKT